jgi:membrane-associated phospholipid phosphatase
MVMSREVAALRRLDGVIWGIAAGIAVLIFLVPLFSSFTIVWISFVVPAAVSAALALAGWFYQRRSDVKLASALTGTAQIVAFAAVGGPLSYLAASFDWPLQDPLFDLMDRLLGFNWRSLLSWMNAHWLLHPLFWTAYASFTVQASTTVVALAFSGRHLELRTFTLAFMLAAIMTIVISAFLPAEGIWGYYALTPADHPAIRPATRELHLAIFHGLRDGSFRQLMGMGSEGIVTFPSLHTALAVIFIMALWPVPVLRWIGATVNVLMIIATPVDGGHYFIDGIAGIVLAVSCWMAAQATTLWATQLPTLATAEVVAGD